MYCMKCRKQIEDDSVYCKYCGKKQVSTNAPKPKKRANGMGTVYKLPGRRRKPWLAMATVDDKRVVIGTYATQTEGYIALEGLRNNSMPYLYDYTVQQIYDMLVEQNRDKLTESGLTNYKSGFNHLKPYAKMKMRDIRTIHFQEAINRAEEQGKGYATWKKIQNVGSLMCQIAMANDLIDKNYAQLVNMPHVHKKKDKVSFSEEQLKRLWELWEEDSVAMAVLAMCYNGLRINEFLDLKKEHIDLNERIINAPGSKTEAGKHRIIPIPQDVVPLYEKMMLSDGEYLFPTSNGNRWDAGNFRKRAFYETLKKYGLDTNNGEKITPHSCRHTYAALCVKSALHEKATMDLMGHTKYSTTVELYAEATKKDIEFLRSEADKIKK